jgi:hypothetical protein
MTKEELKIWFWDKFNSCYPTKHTIYPNSVFMIYDINYIRKKKLANILGKEVGYPIVIKGNVLFHMDIISEWLDIDKDLWEFLKHNYKDDYIEICDLIQSWLKEYEKLKDFSVYDQITILLDNYDNLKTI